MLEYQNIEAHILKDNTSVFLSENKPTLISFRI